MRQEGEQRPYIVRTQWVRPSYIPELKEQVTLAMVSQDAEERCQLVQKVGQLWNDEVYSLDYGLPAPPALFNALARDMFRDLGQLHDPFADLSDTITDSSLNLSNLMRLYEAYLRLNREKLLKDAPRRQTDDRVMEATYHFNLYLYLQRFFSDYNSRVHPEFPTGNGKIDILIQHGGQQYGLEVKSFANVKAYQEALKQAAHYGKQLGLAEISLAFFCDYITDENRVKYEVVYEDEKTGVRVLPVFVATG